jgi:hypothetical protein
MNRLTRHPKPARHFHNRLAIMDNQRHSLIRLLHNTQLHNHERKCQASAETTVQDQPKQHNDIEPPRGFEPRTYALRELGFPINSLNFCIYSVDTFEGF